MKFTFCAKVIKVKETFLLFRICCQCKYGVKAIFNVFALLVIVVQTQSLTYDQSSLKIVFATHVNPSFRTTNLTI